MELLLEADIGGKTLSIETGKVAKQASGSVVVRYGDTVVLVTAVSSDEERMVDFLPLSQTSGNLRAICPVCTTLMHRRLSVTQLDALRAMLEVSIVEADERLTD